MPVYDEIARIPLLIYHPEFADRGGERRAALTQCIDIMPTILEMHDHDIPGDVLGQSLLPLLKEDHQIRDGRDIRIFRCSL